MRQVRSETVRSWAQHLGVDPSDVEADTLRARLVSGTVPQMLEHAARAHPHATLSVDENRVTLTDLHDDVARAASVLATLGVAAGDRVLVSAASSLELVTSYLATLHVGATAVLVNPTYAPDEIRTVLTRAGARLVLTDSTTAPGEHGVELMSIRELLERAAEHPPREPATHDSRDTALLAFTSGTTGTPKGVPLSHGHLLASIRAAMWSWRWQPADTLVHALPLFHQHGLSGVHATLIAGSSAHILSRFDPDRLVQAVDRERATVLFGVPSIHRRLLELPPERLEPLRRLRLVTSGSAPLPVPLAERFREMTGITLLERYGLTESGLNLSNPYAGRRVPGRVGTPLPGVEVDLADDNGAGVATDSPGEIILRGPQVFDGYLDDPAATDAVFWPGGWFRTGDLGRWDTDGSLEITGRLKELVITGGMNVSPAEVEAVVEQLPEVREAAAAGLPSERWGEELVVWVVPHDGSTVDAEQVVSHCRSHLAPYKVPKRVFPAAQLPRNPMGKIVRSRLVEEACS